jgi:inosine-uridine nucleoside N-ribohydrolase
MPKKVLLDVDPGIADTLVLCWAMFDPAVEVVAVTSVGGNVPAPLAATNLQAIIEFLDPPRLPRLGFGSDSAEYPVSNFRHVRGIDDLAETPLPVAELRTKHPAEKVICDVIRDNPDDVIIISMGPLTNIAKALLLDPTLSEKIRHLYITGGTLNAHGNISPCAEFNIYTDPIAAKIVFDAAFTKTMIPLEISNEIVLTLSDLERLPGSDYKLGGLLQSMLLPAITSYQQCYGLPGIHVHDLVSYAVATHPDWAETADHAVSIETDSILTRGMTVVDFRNSPEKPINAEVVKKIDTRAILNEILVGLTDAANQLE